MSSSTTVSQEETFFAERDECLALIHGMALPSHVPKDAEQAQDYQRFCRILDKYQEQSQLLDPHLDVLMEPVMARVRAIVRDRETALIAGTTTVLEGAGENAAAAANSSRAAFSSSPSFRSPAAAQMHRLLQVVYQLTRTRGYKTIVKLLPHEVADVEPVLHLLQSQDRADFDTWETRYCLLLWLSMLSLVPFDLSTIDSSLSSSDSTADGGIVGSIIGLGTQYLGDPGPARESAAVCLSRLLTRPDMEAMVLERFAHWARDALLKSVGVNDSNTAIDDEAADSQDCNGSFRNNALGGVFMQCGVLKTLTEVFKRGRREKLLAMLPALFEPLLLVASTSASHTNTLLRKLVVKLVQRVGLVFMPPRVISWRYQRGKRSLLHNLEASSSATPSTSGGAADTAVGADGGKADGDASGITDDGYVELDADEIPPEEMDEVVEVLLCGLRDRDTVVRWSAAKGVGRVTERLPQIFADDIVGAVLELFAAAEGDGAWHGACLALAELARRGLLLPARLPSVVPLVCEALAYDVRRGSHSVGAHVRDAAAYVCWAFARAYEPRVLAPFVPALACSMLQCAVFDREVNCRRACSAAFQENVGRQGAESFKHGIAIMTVADYATLGNRNTAYLRVARFIASVGNEETAAGSASDAPQPYRNGLLRHLIGAKLMGHWDVELRGLAAHALHELAPLAPRLLVSDSKCGLPALLQASLSPELHVRHGATLGVAEVVLALSKLPPPPENVDGWLDAAAQKDVRNLVPRIEKARLYRGRGGESMRLAVCRAIECIAHASNVLPLPSRTAQRLLDSVRDCLRQPNAAIQAAAASALRPLAAHYGDSSWRDLMLMKLLSTLGIKLIVADDGQYSFDHCAADENPAIRRGSALALGVLSPAMFCDDGHPVPVIIDATLAALEHAVLVDPTVPTDLHDAETRQNAAWAIAELLVTLGLDHRCSTEDSTQCAKLGDTNVRGLPCGITPPRFCRRAFTTLLTALEDDYSTDSRGDVGSWIRIAAVRAAEKVMRLLLAACWRRRRECASAGSGADSGAVCESDAMPDTSTVKAETTEVVPPVPGSGGVMAADERSAAAAAAVANEIAEAEAAEAAAQTAAEYGEGANDSASNANAAGADGGGGGRVDAGVGDRSVDPSNASGGGSSAWFARRCAFLEPWRMSMEYGGDQSTGDGEVEVDVLQLSERLVAALLKQLGEKLDVVRNVAGSALQRLLRAQCPCAQPRASHARDELQPLLPAIAHDARLRQLFVDGAEESMNWALARSTFPLLVPTLAFDRYRDTVLEGLVVSMGGITESVVKASQEALLKWLANGPPAGDAVELPHGYTDALAESLVRVLQRRANVDRVSLPLLKSLDVLLTNSVFDVSTDVDAPAHAATWGRRVLEAVRVELSGCSDVPKLLAAAKVLLGLLALRGSRAADGGGAAAQGIRPAVLQSLLLLLGHRYPKVRKVVAEQFYSASLIVEDIIPPQSMEAVLSLLSETAWDGVRTAAKSARDQLFPLLGVPKPAVKVPNNAGRKKKRRDDDQQYEYAALVREVGY